MPATIFQIEDGELAFSLVDTADAGYADTWQAPNGSTLLDGGDRRLRRRRRDVVAVR